MLGTKPEVKNKPYLASCVVQSQQVLLSTDVDTHCKEMTKSSWEEEGERVRVGRGSSKGGRGSESPTPLCYGEGKQVVLIIATDASQCSWRKSVRGSRVFTEAPLYPLSLDLNVRTHDQTQKKEAVQHVVMLLLDAHDRQNRENCVPTCIMIKDCGHILFWKGVIGIAHQETRFPHCTVSNHDAF